MIGISDSKLSQQLEMDSELTLEKATKVVRQSETVQAQQQIVKGPKTENLSAQVGQMGENEDREMSFVRAKDRVPPKGARFGVTG